MPKLSHEEVVKTFLDSQSVNFEALGKFVAEAGPRIALSGAGDYGVRFGFYNLLACFWIGPPVDVIGNLGREVRGIANEVAGP